MPNSEQNRQLTTDEQFKMLFKRTAQLSDRVSALEGPKAEQGAPVDWQATVQRRERELKAEGGRRHQAEAAIRRMQDAATLHRQGLLGLLELYAVIEAALDEPQKPTPKRTHAADVVAYRSRGGRLLRCLAHHPGQEGIDNGDFVEVTSEDLPDGGICTYPTAMDATCGVDVLITPKEPTGA